MIFTCLRFSRPLICLSRNLWYSFSSIKKLEINHTISTKQKLKVLYYPQNSSKVNLFYETFKDKNCLIQQNLYYFFIRFVLLNTSYLDLGSYILVTSLVCKGHLKFCLLLAATNGANSTPPVIASYECADTIY